MRLSSQIEATTATTKTKNQTKKMKIENAIKKLNKEGFTVIEANGFYSAKKIGCKKLVEFHRNGRSDEATCIGYRRENHHSDSMTDYCATFFCDSLARAIKLALA